MGLLLLRLVAGIVLADHRTLGAGGRLGLENLGLENLGLAILNAIAIGTAILLWFGLWTPVAGAIAAAIPVWTAISHLPHAAGLSILMLEAAVGAALAMIGPGAWSLDAKLFGRKHIDLP